MADNKYIGLNALVTGASSGIGLEFARQLAAYGTNILLVSNQPSELESTYRELSEKYPTQTFYQFCIDLTKKDAVHDILYFCRFNNFFIDILINNAGIFAFKEICSMSEEQTQMFIDLHIKAVTDLSRLVAKDMLRRKCTGYILNMSSMSCWMPMPGIAMYTATKAYIRVLSRSMYLELKENGISVTVACPGGIATSLFGLPENLTRIAVWLGVLATPEKFVRGALKRMFKRRKQYINGLLNRIAIFTVSILPTRVKLIVKHKLLDTNNK